ncbi:unnamed protein product [Agarophyton chilense]
MTSICLLSIALISMTLYVAHTLPSTESQFRAFRVGLSSEGYTSAVSLTTDNHGNTFVVGNTNGSFGKADGENVSADSIFIAKFSRSGILIWLTRTGSASLDKATSIYHFGANLYVTGYTLGNVTLSEQSIGTKFSRGTKDGFVMVYNSFAGKRIWAKQYGSKHAETQIEHVVVSRLAGVVIAGRTDAPLFVNDKRVVSDGEFFLLRLSHTTGRIAEKRQLETNAAWPFPWPQRLLIVEESSSLYVVLHTEEGDVRNMGVVVRMPLQHFDTFERVLTVGEDVLDENIYYGLAHEGQTGKLALSFTKGSTDSLANPMRPAFALRIISNNSRPRQWTERMFSFDQGDEDIVKDVVVNDAGFAMVMGVSKDEGLNKDNRTGVNSWPSLWVYDVRKMMTVGSHVSKNLDGFHCDKITKFDLDSDGNLVYSGVRTRADGTGEVLLGSFGVPPEYKWRAGEGVSKPVKIYVLGNGSITTNEMMAVQDSKRSNDSKVETKEDSLSMGAIASICVGSALVALAFAGFYALVVKRKKRAGRQQNVDSEVRPERLENLFREGVS